MKLSTVASSLMMVMLSGSAFAAGLMTPPSGAAGSGTIKFTGAIIDAPCSIAPDSIDQAIPMGQISKTVLQDGGESVVRNFDIKLEGCESATLESAKVTFHGTAVDPTNLQLALTGSAKGAAIALVDHQSSSAVKLGTPTAAIKLYTGDNTLRFGAKLVRAATPAGGVAPTVEAGAFSASTDFVMTYE